MPDRSESIITGQRIALEKSRLARKLRGEMTASETILWSRLRRNQLRGFHFRRQQLIDGFVVDFYCHSARLVVEVDGPIHEQRLEYDAERDRIIHARGLRVLRVRADDVEEDLQSVLDLIAAATSAGEPPLPFREGAGG